MKSIPVVVVMAAILLVLVVNLPAQKVEPTSPTPSVATAPLGTAEEVCRNDCKEGLRLANSGRNAMNYLREVSTSHFAKWKEAADRGVPEGWHLLGTCNVEGIMVEADPALAVSLFQKAADAGFTLSMHRLGQLYEIGKGVKQDLDESQKWFRKAADMGLSLSMNALGWRYTAGMGGVAKDIQEGEKWFRKAADAGCTAAMNTLGERYQRGGNGVVRDYNEAVNWYRHAADAGDGRGMYNLGMMYENGQGVEKNTDEAMEWFRKGSEAGDSNATATWTAGKDKSPAYLVRTVGFGRKSNQRIAQQYQYDWLEQIKDPNDLLKLGMALYDVKRYPDALAAFEKMQSVAGERKGERAISLIWQGQILDLMDKHKQAVRCYRQVREMKVNSTWRFSQWQLNFEVNAYAEQRIIEPFTRRENVVDE